MIQSWALLFAESYWGAKLLGNQVDILHGYTQPNHFPASPGGPGSWSIACRGAPEGKVVYTQAGESCYVRAVLILLLPFNSR